MRRIINISITLILAIGIVYLFVFANLKQRDVICKEFIINIDYDGAPTLIKTYNIRNEITAAGIRIKGQPVEYLQARKLTTLLNNNPYVKKATISVSVNGVVTANVLQRNPLIRVVDQDFNQCIIDHDGYVMPVSHEFPVRLIVANGNIPGLKQFKLPVSGSDEYVSTSNALKVLKKRPLPTELSKIYNLALELEKDTITSALVEQIYINDNKELELIPKLGNQSIIFGDTTFLKEKVEKLKLFYSEGMKTMWWMNYKTINLKYKNQVVCSK
jgi:cell division protein FtsQ